jgi:antitoxin (DNA-binding transcriptional repressor) of toxin-antitoxin stability system
MKRVEKVDATGTLAEYAENAKTDPVIVTDPGRPVAALVPIENADLETVTLITHPQFVDLIERSRARVAREGAISSAEMRRKFQPSASHAEPGDAAEREKV